MDRSRVAHRLAVILVSVLTVGLVFFSRAPEAAAQSCLDGKAYEVEVIRCDGFRFPDVYCFDPMTVEGLNCASGGTLITCTGTRRNPNATFRATVSGVSFEGSVQGKEISGTALSDDCESTFEGEKIRNCPCEVPGALEGINPYLP